MRLLLAELYQIPELNYLDLKAGSNTMTGLKRDQLSWNLTETYSKGRKSLLPTSGPPSKTLSLSKSVSLLLQTTPLLILLKVNQNPLLTLHILLQPYLLLLLHKSLLHLQNLKVCLQKGKQNGLQFLKKKSLFFKALLWKAL
jgi:hypothetical protein